MKKSFTQKLWLSAAMLSVAYSASAYDVEVHGIFYNLNNGTQVASVTYGSTKYSGEVVIPSEIKVNEVKYTVISPDFVIASPKSLRRRVWRCADALPSAWFWCKHPCLMGA